MKQNILEAAGIHHHTFFVAIAALLSRFLRALASTMTLDHADTASTSELSRVGAFGLVVPIFTAVEATSTNVRRLIRALASDVARLLAANRC